MAFKRKGIIEIRCKMNVKYIFIVAIAVICFFAYWMFFDYGIKDFFVEAKQQKTTSENLTEIIQEEMIFRKEKPSIPNKLHNESDDESTPRQIFFLETSLTGKLKFRQSCSIESAARKHPHHSIRILLVGIKKISADNDYIPLLFKYPNVQLEYVTVKDILNGTVMTEWADTMPWNVSEYHVAHLADILRLAVIWKNGGIYLDLDVIVMQCLSDFRNSMGYEFTNALTNTILIFDKQHPYLNACLDEMKRTYRPHEWAYNGPNLLKRMVEKYCSKITDNETNITYCNDLTLYPPSYFYPIYYKNWKKLFQNEDLLETLLKWTGSYTVHLWNKLSFQEKIPMGKNQPLDILAKRFCPTIYEYQKTVGFL